MAHTTPITHTLFLAALLAIPATAPGEAPGPGAASRATAAVLKPARQAALRSAPDPTPAVEPWVSSSVPTTVRTKLESSFALATRRIQEEPQCRALFAGLEADGLETLKTTLYYPAELKLERRLCPRAYAYTVVGGAPTWLCRDFSRLSDERAALVLLHEALHKAGVNETHDDRRQLAPRAIDKLLSECCGF